MAVRITNFQNKVDKHAVAEDVVDSVSTNDLQGTESTGWIIYLSQFIDVEATVNTTEDQYNETEVLRQAKPLLYTDPTDNTAIYDNFQYILNSHDGYIKFDPNVIIDVPVLYVKYKGLGSIIYARDVNDLQDATKKINFAMFQHDGTVAMSSNLNMANNSIKNCVLVNDLNVSQHNHTGNAINGAKISNAALEEDCISTNKIQDASVTTDKIEDNAIVNSKIANNAVTPDKLSFQMYGVITMWSGNINNIPKGWALCNGSNGTPDLRGRFILGAGGSYNPGKIGGTETVTLTTAQVPSHTHTRGSMDITGSFPAVVEDQYLVDPEGAFYYDGTTYEAEGRGNRGNWRLSFKASKNWSGETSSVGGNGSHDNMPPYYALCYIMFIGA